MVTTNDPDRAQQWYLNSINAYGAWSVAQGAEKVSVAVIDTGIDMDHPDLQSRIVDPFDAVGDGRTDGTPSVPDDSPDDVMGHGTHVAGIACAAADNGVGIAGVSYNADVVPIKVFYYSDLSRGYIAESKDIVSAYQHILGPAGDGSGRTIAQKDGIRVVNMSLGDIWYEGSDGADDTAVLRMIDLAAQEGIATVCAAGNDEYPLPYDNWPSDYETCIAVIATTESDRRAEFSNYGAAKDIAAPGQNIYSTYLDGGYYTSSGTSMASPVVSGVMALMFAANPAMTVDEAKNVLYSTAVDLGDPGFDAEYGHGRIDALAAVTGAKGLSRTPVSRIDGLTSTGTVGEPVALFGTVVPQEASQNIIFSLKSPGNTGAVVNGATLVGTHAGTATLLATVLGGNADGSNYTQEFTVKLEGDGSKLWNGTADTSWYSPQASEFTLDSAEQLAGLALIVNGTASGIQKDSFTGKTVRLGSDIMLNPYAASGETLGQRSWVPIGDINIPGGEETNTDVFFDGTFDGDGHTISNIYIDGAEGTSLYGGAQGLFGALGENAVISNVGLEGGWIFGRVAGGIAACSHTGSADRIPRIVGCYNTATIENYGSSSRGVGGIFGGENQAGSHAGTDASAYRGAVSIADCYNLGTIKGYVGSPAGGIAGLGSIVMSSCYNAGTIESVSSYVGSLVGMLLKEGAPVPEAAGDFAPNGAISTSYALAGTCSNLYRYQDETHNSSDKAGTDASDPQPSKTFAFVDSAALRACPAELGGAFVADPAAYPLLYWQVGVARIDISTGTLQAAPCLYTGQPVIPTATVKVVEPGTGEAITLTEGSDYTLTAQNNIDPGTAYLTATGTGRYTGTLHTTFQVVQVSLDECTIEPIPDQWIYGDGVAEPPVTVRAPGNIRLRQGKDYSVTYTDNDKPGRAAAIITGFGTGVTGSRTVSFGVAQASDSLSGTGTEADPYLIGSKGDFQFAAAMVNGAVGDYPRAAYRLTDDVDVRASQDSPAADPLGIKGNRFSGAFDGAGHRLSVQLDSATLSASLDFSPSSNTLALFAAVGAEGATVTIKDLTLSGTIRSDGEAGGFIGGIAAGTAVIDGCVNEASVTGGGSAATAAGFAAWSNDGAGLIVRDSANKGAITAVSDDGNGIAAGFAADLWGGSSVFRGCINEGAVIADKHAAGIIGNYYPDDDNVFAIERCANKGSVSGGYGIGGNGSAGGLVGCIEANGTSSYRSCSIYSSYNTGNVSAHYGVGGLVGRIYYVSVSMGGVYNTGAVHSNNDNRADITCCPGGLVGYLAYNGTWDIASAYNAGPVSVEPGISNPCGAIVGCMNMGSGGYPVANLDHVLYEEGSADNPVGLQMEWPFWSPVVNGHAEELDVDSLKSAAERLGSIYLPDDEASSLNDGYPVLHWQRGEEGTFDLADPALTAFPIADQRYTGSPIIPALELAFDGHSLVAGVDYTVQAQNNTDVSSGASKAILTLTGKGRFTGVRTMEFSIVPCNLSECTIASIADQFVGQRPAIAVTGPLGVLLAEGFDYGIDWDAVDLSSAGSKAITLTGLGNYTGQTTASFTAVSSKEIRSADVGLIANQTYSGIECRPVPTVTVDGQRLQADVDFTVSYADNIAAGTASLVITGTDAEPCRYTGAVTKRFMINPASLSMASLAAVANQPYTGQPVEPALSLTFNGKALVRDVDYAVEFANNVNVGIATLRLTGMGNFQGAKTASFNIVSTAKPIEPAPSALDIYVQEGASGQKKLAATLSAQSIGELAADHSDVAGGYLYSSDGTAKVIAAQRYATIDQLLAAAGLAVETGDSLTVTDGGRGLVSYSYSAADLREQSMFFPLYRPMGSDDDRSVGFAASVPPIIALDWVSASIAEGQTAAEAFTEAEQSDAIQHILRFMTGVSQENYLAADYPGMRFVNNVGSLTLVKAPKPVQPAQPTQPVQPAATSISKAVVTLSASKAYYTGKALTPAVASVRLGGAALRAGTDYTVAYANNVNIGTATVTVTGKGAYAGTAKATFSIAARKGAAFSSGNIRYKVTSASAVAVAAGSAKKAGAVSIPATVRYGGKSFKVTSVAAGAFKGYKRITRVALGRYVASVGTGAFRGCTRLARVSLGASVSSIGAQAFQQCTRLAAVSIPASVKSIGKRAFYKDSKLKSITIKSARLASSKVGAQAFKGVHKRAVFKVPAKQLKSYTKILRKKGATSSMTVRK